MIFGKGNVMVFPKDIIIISKTIIFDTFRIGNSNFFPLSTSWRSSVMYVSTDGLSVHYFFQVTVCIHIKNDNR